jgi:hypothetical protein
MEGVPMRATFFSICIAAAAFLLLAFSACAQTEPAGEPTPATEEGGVPCAGTAVTEPIDLFNGEDLDNWKLFIPDENVDPATVWSVADGVVRCTGSPAGYMRTKVPHSNYRLIVEWRWPGGEGGNSGVLLHIQEKDEVWPKSIEAQLHTRNAGDFWVIGGATFKEHTSAVDRRVPKMKDSNENPIGEWNRYLIECRGDTIKVYVNGLLQNAATEVTICEGYIGLQSEGTPIEFRTVRVEPLD